MLRAGPARTPTEGLVGSRTRKEALMGGFQSHLNFSREMGHSNPNTEGYGGKGLSTPLPLSVLRLIVL